MKKRSAAQRRASLANLRKARRKRAGAAAPKKRHRRARAAAAPKRRHKRARAAAPKRKRHRRARAQAAAPRRRAKRRTIRRSRRRRSARDYEMTDEQLRSTVGKNGGFRRAKKRGGTVKRKRKSSRRGRRGHSKRRAAPRKRYLRKVRGTSRRRVIRSKSRRHRVKGYVVKRGRRAGKRVKAHYSYEAGAMENPLSTGEVVVTGLLAIVGGVVAQGVDRYLATHALTGTIDPATGGGLQDQPAVGQDYNVNTVSAPMNMARWGAAAALAFLPIIGAHYVKSPMARTSLQALGFGALIRGGVKGLSDAAGWLLRKNAMGQRLFMPEIVAHAADKASLASTSTTAPPAIPALIGGATVTANMLAGTPKGVGGCQTCGQQGQHTHGAPPAPPPGAPPFNMPVTTPNSMAFAGAPPAVATSVPVEPPQQHQNGVGSAPEYTGTFFSPHLRSN